MHQAIKARLSAIARHLAQTSDPANIIAYEFAASQLRSVAKDIENHQISATFKEPESLVRHPTLAVVWLLIPMIVLVCFEGWLVEFILTCAAWALVIKIEAREDEKRWFREAVRQYRKSIEE